MDSEITWRMCSEHIDGNAGYIIVLFEILKGYEGEWELKIGNNGNYINGGRELFPFVFTTRSILFVHKSRV